MATIITLGASDLISNSRADINTSLANLNTDKMETSVLDTDTTLAANSDAKVATQKAVKAYVDAGGNVNASTTARGIVEEATQAEVDAGTAAGGTGARLFVNPSTLTSIQVPVTSQKYAVGALAPTYAKTYFNIQSLFLLYEGATNGDLTTSRVNWEPTSECTVQRGGMMAVFTGTGVEYLANQAPFITLTDGTLMLFSATNSIVMDWWAKLPATSTGDITIGGFSNDTTGLSEAYNSSTYNKIAFIQKSTGELYATQSKAGVGVTNTDISSGYTATQWNNFRIEATLGTNALFYVNGTLKATLTTNIPVSGVTLMTGFGRSNTGSFAVTAPSYSIDLVP